jgi:hypothetical protein
VLEASLSLNKHTHSSQPYHNDIQQPHHKQQVHHQQNHLPLNLNSQPKVSLNQVNYNYIQ